MIWLFACILVVLVGFWIQTLRRRLLLEEAIRFGQEFYDVNLTVVVGNTRRPILREMKIKGASSPQSVFFMIVPSVLGVLDGQKKLELYDGISQMKATGNINKEIFDNFYHEYHRLNAENYNWAKDALGVSN